MYNFESVSFSDGAHKTREDGMCIMEAVAFIAGEDHTDKPACVDLVLGKLARVWNDHLKDEDRARVLGPFLWRFPGTEAGSEVSLTRARMLQKCLVHEMAPLALEMHGLPGMAALLKREAASPPRPEIWPRPPSLYAIWSAQQGFLNVGELDEAAACYAIVRRAAEFGPSFCPNALRPPESYEDRVEFRNAIEDMAINLLDRCIKLTEIQEIVRPQEWHCRAKSLEATL